MDYQYDYLIVGSGLYGATFAYMAKQRGKKCLVIDKRPYLGGNVYCENIEGINVHKYGAHIFHTSDDEVWNFVNSIVKFNRYTNSPVAYCKGKLYNLPFNMNTFWQMWGTITPLEAKCKMEQQRKQAIQKMKGEGVKNPRNLEEQALALVGTDIYETLIKGYTEKQWGRKCVDLPAFIIKRLPVRFVFDNNYFNDKYQGIPIGGYNTLISGLLNGIEVKVNTDFFEDRIYWQNIAANVIFTGKIDEFYDYSFGQLDYRTVRFDHVLIESSNYQGNAVVNYTDLEVPYTRIIEHKHFECFGDEIERNPRTVISKEYSMEWKKGLEPYYPINNDINITLYKRYEALSKQEKTVHFGGRLAEYKYYDMHHVIRKVLDYWRYE